MSVPPARMGQLWGLLQPVLIPRFLFFHAEPSPKRSRLMTIRNYTANSEVQKKKKQQEKKKKKPTRLFPHHEKKQELIGQVLSRWLPLPTSHVQRLT